MNKRKKNWKQIVAMLLVIAFFVTSIPYEGCVVNAQEVQEEPETSEPTDEEEPQGTPADSYEVSEEDARLEENTETSTTFDVSKNKKMTVFYQEAVRYKDENGELVDYDPSLTKVSEEKTENDRDLDGYLYENAEGDKKQYFPENLTEDTPILMEHEDYGISMNPTENLKSAQIEKEEYTNGYEETQEVPLKAVYDSGESAVSYEYTSTASGVKEEIVLKEHPESNTFTYDLRLSGMFARKNQLDEGITLYDSKTEDIVGNILPPNMNDATGEAYSEKLTSEIVKDEAEEGLYHVTITADQEYLNSPERKYPVTIDPSASWSGKSDIGDAYVLSGSKYKGINFYDSGVVVINAGKGSKGIYRTYMKFVDLTTKIKGYYVDSAVLKLYETANSNSGQTVQAYRVKESWTCGKLTWNNRPGYDTLYSSVKSTGKYKTARSLNLTTFARGIANSSIKNYGIMLKGATETGKYCEFVGSRHSTSSLRPKLSVVYYNRPTAPTGLTVTPQFLKKGTQLKATWSGISSKSLAYVQYRLARCNAAGTESGAVINYSASTKLGTAGSGTAAVAASSGWGEGIYKLAVRGVDNGGLAGGESGAVFYIDGTPPALNQPQITPASSAEEPSDSTMPTITWSGASDTYFKQMEYKIDNGSYMAMGTAASGSYTIPEGKLTANGEHTITVRAVDKAGNEKSYALKYNLYRYGLGFEGYLPKDGSLKIRNEYGKNIIFWQTENKLDDSVYYRIYRGENENFTPSEENMVCKKVIKGYWVDIESVSDKKYYYKVEAVRANTAGDIENQTLIQGVLSMDGTNPDKLQKKTGNKEYLGYYTFSTPVGSGSIENSSGNLSYSQEDVTLPTNQLSFDVTRYYNSQMSLEGMLGKGWTDSLHKELLTDASGKMYFLDSDGSVYTFEKKDNAYVCKETKDYTLQSEETVAATPKAALEFTVETTEIDSEILGSITYELKSLLENTMEGFPVFEEITVTKTHAYTIKTKDGILYRFNKGGQLVSTIEPNGNFLLYEYSADGRLESVKTNAGKAITFAYDPESGLLTKVSLPDKTELVYTYDNHNLTQTSHVSEDGKSKVSFQYGYTEDKLTSITDGKAQEYKVSYQGDKADKVTYPNKESYELNFQTDQTSVTKKNESGTAIYTTSTEYEKSTGKTLKRTDAEGKVTSYEYGYDKNPYLVTKTKIKIGYEVINGGKVEFKTEEKVSETTYNEDENVKSEKAEDGTVTTYSYDTTSEWTQDSPKAVNSELNGTALSKETTTYDADGNIIKEVDTSDPENPVITVSTYDEDGNLIEEIETEDDMEVSKSVYEYDEDGNIIHETETTGDVITEEKNTYDAMGRALKTTDETTGEVTEYTYDYLGRTVKTATALNGKTQTSTSAYDANGTVVKETDTAGITTEYAYDSINRVTERKVTKGDSITYKTAYSYGDVKVHDGRSERTVQNAYIEKESYPDGSTSSEKYYDNAGKLVKEKANGLYTDYTYDESGNQVAAYSNGNSAQKADGRVTLTLYDAKGMQTASVMNPSIQGSDYQIGEDTVVTEQEYDDKGNVTKETDARGTVTEYVYDDSARVTQVTQDTSGEKVVTKAAYTTDAQGGTTTTTITDAKGHTSVEVTDAAGLTKKTTDNGDDAQESIATAYEYDSRGNQTKVTYENDAYKTFTYDDRNLLVKTQMYDSSGAQTLQTEYTYDDQYRQTKMVDLRKKDGALTPYRYTMTGYDGFGRTAWTAEVDSESEPSEETIGRHKITYSYDAEDKVTGIRYALVTDGGVAGLEYTYDENRWLKSVKAVMKGSESKPTVREYAYDAQRKVSEIKEYPGFADGASGNGAGNTCIIKTYSYDSFDRVVSMTYKKGSEVLESYAYKYDKNSNITEKTEINNTPKTENDKVNVTKAYTYNALGQLTKTELTDHKDGNSRQTITYEYDKAGNRTKKVKGSSETTYTYNGLDQLLTAVTQRGGAEESRSTYTYDVNGNQLKEVNTKNHVTTMNEYDADNRLSKATITTATSVPSGGTEEDSSGNNVVNTVTTQENLYNGDGQRIKKTEGAKETSYFYQDGVVSYTTEGSADTKVLQNLLGLEGNVIAAEQKTKAAETEGDSFVYHLYNKDIQGSTTSILDESGAGELFYEYEDFGETEVHGSEAFKNEICYTGGIYDATTGHYYLNARYYDPETGRFLTEDTYRGELKEPDTLHLYAYCKNNPINYVDPSGHAAINVVFATVGGVIGWKLGDYVAKKLGYRSGKKYWAIRAGVTVGGAAIGWFSAKIMTRILTNYLKNNPTVVLKLVNKLGPKKLDYVMKFLGINPFSIPNNKSLFIAFAKKYNSKNVTLGYEWALKLHSKAKSFGVKLILDKPHGGYGWHIHLNAGRGKLKNIHIQIVKSAWNYLSKIVK